MDTFGTKQNCPDYRGVHISGLKKKKFFFSNRYSIMHDYNEYYECFSLGLKYEVMLDCTEQLI